MNAHCCASFGKLSSESPRLAGAASPLTGTKGGAILIYFSR